jgi:hypothetical protein
VRLEVVMDWCQADDHATGGPVDKAPSRPVLCVRVGDIPICVYCFNLPVLDALDARKQRRLASDDPAVREDEEAWSMNVLDEYAEHLMEAMYVRSMRKEHREDVTGALVEAMRIVAG